MSCCVPFCKSKGQSTFGVPKDVDQLNLWKVSLGIDFKSFSRVCSNLENFGNEVENKISSNKKANHGLVFMWQSLADKFVQPITVFASNGPVKGEMIINNRYSFQYN